MVPNSNVTYSQTSYAFVVSGNIKTTEMSIFTGWKKKYTFLNSSGLDEVDRAIAGDSFAVKYLGQTDITINPECTAREILSRYSMKHLKTAPTQELMIDSTSITLRDNGCEDRPSVWFTIPISEIKNVIYRKRDGQYGNYCIFVARDVRQRCLRAHVVSCNSSEETAKVFKSFQAVFNV